VNKLPRKLEKYLATLPEEEREERIKLFEELEDIARKQKFQSPRFWAMRQVISELPRGAIDIKINRRISRQMD
jgi:hypothetical protein